MNSPNTMQRDFKSLPYAQPKILRRLRQQRWPLLIGIIALFAIATLMVITPATATRTILPQQNVAQHIDTPDNQQRLIKLALPAINSLPALLTPLIIAANPLPEISHSHTVQRGDSLSTIFNRIGLPPTQTHAVISLNEDTQILSRLHPGDILKVYTSKDNRKLHRLVYEINETRRLEISLGTAGLHSTVIETPIEIRLAHTIGTIKSSLFLSAQQAGMSDNLTMELANLFGWDVDFSLDIRTGDQFSLIYEEHYLQGKKLRDGYILAAEFINQSRSYRAVRFTDSNNNSAYFSPDGKSIRKAFLRSPVDFKRISSRFNPRRKHPKLNLIRAHKGVDYAASRGTPIRATGDGKIILRGRKGGYGRTVIIQHGSTYSTLYAHLNSYARSIRNGAKVRQGQTIGFVGSSGLATGPHLHYEFRVNGVHRNPLTVRLPDASPLSKKYISAFKDSAKPLLAQLDTLKRSTLAFNSLP